MGMKRLLAVAAAASLVTVGAVASSAQADPVRGAAAYSTALSWGTCTDAVLQSRKAECGLLSVPLDYTKPAGRKIQLAVSRIKHTTTDPAKYQGVMLVNPGGPGGSGYALSTIGTLVPDQAGAGYDWIGFDPRGVGASKPALTCDSKYEGYNRPAYVPTTRAREQTWRIRAKRYAQACAKAGGALLDHIKTTDTVQDMESIRTALGAGKISFYGFSYGTYLGQVYATLHPDRIHRMVLDGVVDPGRVWYESNLDQDIAFERNMKIYFGWLAKYNSVYHLGKNAAAVQRVFYATQQKLIRQPAAGVIGPDELTDMLLQAGYYVFGWQEVAAAFSGWVNDHNPALLKSLYDTNNPPSDTADNGYSIYLAVQCTDVRWPLSWRKWKTDNWRVHRIAPFETWANAWYNAPCLDWAGTPGKPVRVDGSKAPPALLLSETLDAATPYSGSLEVRKIFPRSALIEGVGGTTHAGSLFGNACMDKSVAAYLATGAMPRRVKADRSDKRCTPLPQPDPTRTPRAESGRIALQRAIVGR
jgi:pimeloyl-ACP methyl ester carboxylesterase